MTTEQVTAILAKLKDAQDALTEAPPSDAVAKATSLIAEVGMDLASAQPAGAADAT